VSTIAVRASLSAFMQLLEQVSRAMQKCRKTSNIDEVLNSTLDEEEKDT